MNKFHLLVLTLLALFHKDISDKPHSSLIHVQYSNILHKENIYIYNITNPMLISELKPINILKLNLNLTSCEYHDRLLELEKENIYHISTREYMTRNLISQLRYTTTIDYMISHLSKLDYINLLIEFKNKGYHTLLDTKIVWEFITVDEFYMLDISRLTIENNKIYYIYVSGLVNKYISF